MRLAMTPAASSDPHVKQRELETYARRLAARCAPELCGNVALFESRGRREGRELAAPMAPVRMKCTGQEPQVRPRHPGLPCAMVLTLIRALPGDRLSCPHVTTTRDARCARHQLRDARTTRFPVRVLPFVRELLLRMILIGSCAPAAACRVHRIPLPTSVTIAIRPSAERNGRRIGLIWGKRQAIYVFPKDLTRLEPVEVVCPAGNWSNTWHRASTLLSRLAMQYRACSSIILRLDADGDMTIEGKTIDLIISEKLT